MSRLERLDRYQRRHATLGLPLAVIYKFFDDRGTQRAATITYYGFVALFPLLLLFFSAAGFFLDGSPTLRRELEESAVRNLPIIGTQLRENIGSFHGSALGVAIGVLGTLYGGTGVMQAAQASFNHLYGVPRNEQPNPLKSRLRSLALLALLGTGVLVSGAIAVAVSTANGLSKELDPLVQALGLLLSFALAVALLVAAFELLTVRDLRAREVLLGGLFGAVCWELLQVGGAAFVTHELKHAHVLYGTFALVLGAIGWVYLQSIALLLAAEINVVLTLRLWPRALLSPFSEAAELTDADRRAYTMYAMTQRFKGFEQIEPRFGRARHAPAGVRGVGGQRPAAPEREEPPSP